MLEDFSMSALKSTPTLRWERQEKDEKEVPASEQRVHRQFVGKLLWIDRANLRCAMGKASSSLGRAIDTDMRNVKSTLRNLRGNPGIMTVRPTTLNLEAVKRALVSSVPTCLPHLTAPDAMMALKNHMNMQSPAPGSRR